MHHEMIETDINYDEHGRTLYVWRCTCGSKGSGSLKMAQTLTGFRRHIQQALRREGYWQ